ncbi:MAG TPA: DUF5995 family protein [Candidatus Limnocylindrales bacterium]|nr:DUF5995 family protein [Candidatus Limnocylindrales bacterium]
MSTMNLAAKPYFDQADLQGVDDVLLALENLGHNLPQKQLAMLDNFNKTYLIITRNVRQQLRKGAFEHPDFLHQFDTRFAYYYLRALKGYLQNQEIPRAWRRAFRTARHRYASPFVCMALGVNAHVNNDIAQVLRDCKATKQHYRDYRLVNSIIKDSLDEVIDLFRGQDRLLSPHRRLLRPIFKAGMAQLVKIWRFTAWRKFRKLQRRELSVPRLETRADKVGKGIAKLPI